MPTHRVTIVDVAAHAGVHPGTVSRALSRPERVAAETRQRVEDAVRELGFVPNRAARRLITGRTGALGVIVPDITNPHFASMVRAVQRAARERDLQMLLVDTGEHPDEEVRAVRTLLGEVDGFIIVSPRRLHRQLDVLGDARAVFVNRPVREHASVLLRTAPAVGDALRHLAGLGHRRLVYLGGPRGSWAAVERRDAVRATGAETGIEIVEVTVESPTFDAVHHVVDRVVASGATAVLAFNDQMALGVVAGLTRLGVDVPGELSVVGCDDVPMAAIVAPPLSTIRLPSDAAGVAAVSLLHEGSSRTELHGTFVVRESTATVTRPRATGGARPGRRPSAGGPA